jgi:transketolase
LRGVLTDAEMASFCSEGGELGVHPEHSVPGVDFSTGSLGQGLCVGNGAALAARLQGSARRVFVLVSDAECNEGSLWEAAMFAAHHRLANLVAIVDCNGQQALGYTRDILDPGDLGKRWRAFGWDVHDVDGHDVRALQETCTALDISGGPPHVLIAHTVFGRGVSFMEGRLRWHYMPMSKAEYAAALAKVSEADLSGAPQKCAVG